MRLKLQDLGWNHFFKSQFAKIAKPGWIPGRLIRENKINYWAIVEGPDEIPVVLSGKVWHDAKTDADLPAVGDWVAIERGKSEADEHVIRARLARRTCFSRKAPGRTCEEQVIAANVDFVVIMTDPGEDFNPRRMERYMTLVRRSHAKAVILINKADEFPKKEQDAAAAEIQRIAPEAEVCVVSAVKGTGLKVLKKHLVPGKTMTLVGSSGVGKSTLINQLMGEEWQWIGEVNEVTGKGRHTTTARELVVLEDGGMIIDNPGMREIQLWTDEPTLRESFADVEALAGNCQFADCKHRADTGCAIREAVENKQIDSGRYENFLNLESEIAALAKRHEKRQMTIERVDKRNRKVKARNYEDRLDDEKQKKPHSGMDWEERF